MYLLMANAHGYAIDYIEQAPVILLAAAHGESAFFIQEQFRKMCEVRTACRCGYLTPRC